MSESKKKKEATKEYLPSLHLNTVVVAVLGMEGLEIKKNSKRKEGLSRKGKKTKDIEELHKTERRKYTKRQQTFPSEDEWADCGSTVDDIGV